MEDHSNNPFRLVHNKTISIFRQTLMQEVLVKIQIFQVVLHLQSEEVKRVVVLINLVEEIRYLMKTLSNQK
jgi:hypothetical protein